MVFPDKWLNEDLNLHSARHQAPNHSLYFLLIDNILSFLHNSPPSILKGKMKTVKLSEEKEL